MGFHVGGEPDSERQPRFENLTTPLMPLFKQLREEGLWNFRFAIHPCYIYLTIGFSPILWLEMVT